MSSATSLSPTNMPNTKTKQRNYGLVIEPIVEGDHYVLSGYSAIAQRPVIMPEGHGWSAFKPLPELQERNGLETMNCTVFGTHNAYETLARKKDFNDFPRDCSERYGGVVCATTPTGNSPHAVVEIIRTVAGVIPELVLPWTDEIDTWDEFYHPKPMDDGLLALGSAMLKRFTFGHEWVFNGRDADKAKKLIYALERGTVCISMFAWRKEGEYYVKPAGATDNHWLQLLDYVKNKYWLVYDHYEDVEKKIKWNTDFTMAKVYYLERGTTIVKKNFWDSIWDNFAALFTKIRGL